MINRNVFKPLLALSLALALSPLAVRWVESHTFDEAAQSLGDAALTELRDTFNPGKLLRWGETALSLPGAMAELFEAGEQPAIDQQMMANFNQHLGWQLHRFHDLYFEQAGIDEYTVVTYDIDASGHIYNVRVLPEYTTAPLDVAQLAAETVRNANGNLPALPEGVESATVTELFWTGSQLNEPESLVNHLSSLPDGRLITPQVSANLSPCGRW